MLKGFRVFLTISTVFMYPIVQAESYTSSTIEAAKKLAELFGDMLSPFERIGKDAEKAYFIDQLLSLNKDMFEVEQEKRYLILALKRKTINEAEIEASRISLSRKVDNLRDSLINLAPKLRVSYRNGAEETIALLSESIVTRKALVYDISEYGVSDPKTAIKEAEVAIDALSKAQSALADAVNYLQKQE